MVGPAQRVEHIIQGNGIESITSWTVSPWSWTGWLYSGVSIGLKQKGGEGKKREGNGGTG